MDVHSCQCAHCVSGPADHPDRELHGRLNLLLPEADDGSHSKLWFQVERDDGFFVPAGAGYQLFNMTDGPVRLLFGVAPTYLQPRA